MRDEENESEEGAVEDDYGSSEIGGFGEISGEIGDEIGLAREKNSDAKRKEQTQMHREKMR